MLRIPKKGKGEEGRFCIIRGGISKGSKAKPKGIV